jgi:hypothetical protein
MAEDTINGIGVSIKTLNTDRARVLTSGYVTAKTSISVGAQSLLYWLAKSRQEVGMETARNVS